MSSACPQCGSSIDQDFGVVTCSQCHAVLFIDLEGQVEMTEKAPSETESPEEPLQEPDPHQYQYQEPLPQTEELDAQYASELPGNSVILSNQFEGNGESSEPAVEFQDQWMQDQDPAPGAPQQFGVQLNSDNEIEPGANPDFGNFESDAEEADRSETGFQSDSSSQGLSDVSEFGNTDQAFGPLSYSVMIEQIDTKELRLQLTEALTDSKFQWDVKDLIKQIKMGKLEIKEINPVKASVLISRLQELPLKVSWVQHAYS